MSTAIINGERRARCEQPNFTINIYQVGLKIAVVLCSALCRRYTLLHFGKPGEIKLTFQRKLRHLFQDVRISQAGGRLVVTVVESLVINKVVFEGNYKVKDEQVASEMQSKRRGTFSRAVVQSDAQRIVASLPLMVLASLGATSATAVRVGGGVIRAPVRRAV
jgi:hypothetical protein